MINNKFYVGKDKNNNPKYFGSGKILRLAIEKYGNGNFKKEIIEECKTNKELNEREIYWIDKLKPQYNLARGGCGGNTLKYADEKTIKKYKETCRKSYYSKTILTDGYKNRGEKISKSKKGIKFSGEHIKNLSISHKNQNPWNKGLTKENNDNIKKYSETKKYKFSNEIVNLITLLYRQVSPNEITKILKDLEIKVSNIVVRRILKENNVFISNNSKFRVGKDRNRLKFIISISDLGDINKNEKIKILTNMSNIYFENPGLTKKQAFAVIDRSYKMSK